MVISESIFRASQAVSGLVMRGAELSELSVPRFFGAKAAKLVAGQAVAGAVIDAERAAQLLEESQMPKASVDSVRQAAQMLRDTPLKTDALHTSGTSLSDVATKVLADNADTFAAARLDHARELTTRPAETLDATAIADLAALADTPAITAAIPQLGKLTGLEREALQKGALTQSSIRTLDDARIVQSYAGDVSAMHNELLRISSLEPATISAEEWRTLRALTNEPAGAARDLPMQLPGVAAFESVAHSGATGTLDASAAERYFAQWKLTAMPDSELADTAAALLGKDPQTLGKADWQLLEAAHRRSPQMLTADADRASKFSELIGAAATSGTPEPALSSMLAARRVEGASQKTLTELTTELINRDPANFTSEDWSLLGALLEADPDGIVIKGARKLDGIADINKWIPGLVTGQYSNDGAIDRYFAAWRAAAMPVTEQRKLATELINRDPNTLTKADWATLDGLLNADPDGKVIKGPRKLLHGSTIDKWIPGLISKEYTNSGTLDRYFAAWRASAMPITEQRKVAAELISRDPNTLTKADWATLDGLLNADPDGKVIKGTRKIRSLASVNEWTPGLATGEYTNDGTLDRYFGAWRTAATPQTEQRKLAAELLSREPDTFSRTDWATLDALLAADTDQTIIKGPRKLNDAASAAEWTPGLITGKYTNDGTLDRYLAAWRTAAMPITEQRKMADELISRDPSTFSKADWATLDGLLNADPDGKVIKGARKLKDSSSIGEWTAGLIRGKYTNDGTIERYFSSWKFANTPPDKMRALARDIVLKDPNSVTKAEWSTMLNILEADPYGEIIDAPHVLGEHAALERWLPGLITGKYANDGTLNNYFAAWRRKLDPEYQTKFSDAVTAMMSGTPTAEQIDLLVGEGTDALKLVTERPLNEQGALALHLLQSTSFSATRNTLPALNVARESLIARTDLPAEALALRDETVRLLDSNISRINGSTLAGDVRGYSNHPDYAQIGEIRSNMDALDMLARQHAAPVAPAAPVIPAATEPSDVIVW